MFEVLSHMWDVSYALILITITMMHIEIDVG